MSYTIAQWPLAAIYPKEMNEECPEAEAEIDVLLKKMQEKGPSLVDYGHQTKNLGKSQNGLWQANLKVERKQVRILYAPYGKTIVLFRIHKKSSPQEQNRAYDLAGKRKKKYEFRLKQAERKSYDGNSTIH